MEERRSEESHDAEFSSSDFTARERRRLRKLVRDDDLSTFMQRTILKWLAICASIAAMVVLLSDKIRLWLRWIFAP